MSRIYRYFAGQDKSLDFSDDAALEAYRYETTGKGNLKQGLFGSAPYNGFAVGKHWMDATIKMWREDIRKGLLRKCELYQDPELIEWTWWLDKVLRGL